ncbi:hypothetical protein P154DRAFT_114324 [Amniculicola lignicola CBS 123094]|uniref:SigF-like NTF2-like domain-containing protein n=1 Tax=Amniculicola lignicola CBS 123094 TaxID=1392246 RepID=A0A6A5WZJ4_9PLEO|nr:hypothetical protein P154DRAFT_114324 [Amniculicola lignicola CBS 123094]
MNSPSAQIPSVLASLLAAKSPTDQFHYLRKYLTSDASLISPIYNIPPSPRSRDDYISRALLFFRMWVRECDVKVRRWAWNEGKGVAFLEVEIVPVVRGVVGIRENLRGYLGWVGGERIAKWEVWERWRGWSVGGVVVLGLRKDVGGVWRVGKIEVLGQPVVGFPSPEEFLCGRLIH